MPIPETIQEELSVGGTLRIKKHVKPAAFSESLRIIVEIDGISHYAKPIKVVEDEERDALFRHLHIDTVRIPYWIQLSKANINFLFSELKFSDARVHIEREMCELKHSFFCQANKDIIDSLKFYFTYIAFIDWCTANNVTTFVKTNSLVVSIPS